MTAWPALLVCLSSLASPGCSTALFSVITFRREAPLTSAEMEKIDSLLQVPSLSKAEVLSTLGPPITVIGQAQGDVFVYRRQAADTSIININPAFIVSGSPPVSLYYDSDESYRDDVLMVFFDGRGKVAGHAFTRGSLAVDESRAARLGESVREVLR